MKKGIIIAIVVIAGGAGIYLVLSKNQAQAPVSDITNQTSSQTQNQTTPPAQEQTQNQATSSTSSSGQNKTATTTSPTPSQGVFSNGEEQNAPDVQVVKIDYDGSKFTPSAVNIKVNDWVFFKNNSSSNFQPASNPHPTHTDYPEFDARPGVTAGGTYKFQFTKAGSWGFHDHLNPQAFGKINVSQ